MIITSVHIKNWSLVITGTEKGKAVKTYCAIPPTNGNRVDVITSTNLEHGYRYDVGLIVIDIKHGVPWVHLYC